MVLFKHRAAIPIATLAILLTLSALPERALGAGNRYSFDFKEVSIAEAIEEIRAAADVEIQINKELTGATISGSFTDEPVEIILKKILRGYTYILREGEDQDGRKTYTVWVSAMKAEPSKYDIADSVMEIEPAAPGESGGNPDEPPVPPDAESGNGQAETSREATGGEAPAGGSAAEQMERSGSTHATSEEVENEVREGMSLPAPTESDTGPQGMEINSQPVTESPQDSATGPQTPPMPPGFNN